MIEHGVPFLAWELRGGRVCIDPDPGGLLGPAPPQGVRFVIAPADRGGLPYREPAPGPSRRPLPALGAGGAGPRPQRCPLIAVRQARQGPARD